MRGMLIGMSLDVSITDLALRYFATSEAIAVSVLFDLASRSLTN
jgi:ribulose kinase